MFLGANFESQVCVLYACVGLCSYIYICVFAYFLFVLMCMCVCIQVMIGSSSGGLSLATQGI